MVEQAVRSLAVHGYAGTSFSQVLADAEAPRGSTYHHFPGGKQELVDAAIRLAGERAETLMEAARGEGAIAVVRRFFAAWRRLLEASGLHAGCSVLAVAVGSDEPEQIRTAGRTLRAWRQQLESLLTDGGLPPEDARRLAALTVAAAEGAVALARAEGDWEPFDLAEAAVLAEAARLAAF